MLNFIHKLFLSLKKLLRKNLSHKKGIGNTKALPMQLPN